MSKKIFGTAKIIFDAVKITVVIELVSVSAAIILLTLPPLAGGNKALVVLSDSMKPTMPAGSLVVTLPVKSSPILLSPVEDAIKQAKFSLGDVVSYKLPGAKNLVTHRVVNVQEENGGFVYQTKGDANNTPDQIALREKDIVGRVVLAIPYLGFLVGFAKTIMGLLVMVALPGLYVVAAELFSIIREIRKKRGFNFAPAT